MNKKLDCDVTSKDFWNIHVWDFVGLFELVRWFINDES